MVVFVEKDGSQTKACQVSGLLPLLTWLICILTLSNCSSGTAVLDEPIAMQTSRPLTSESDENIEVTLYWVIVRNGPGTWASNADWDEYLMQVKNVSDETVEISSVVVVDSLDYRLEASADLQSLIDGSRSTASRYEDSNIEVRAGLGTDTMMAAGAAMTLTGAAAVAATTSVTMTGLLGSSPGWSIAGPAAAAVGVLIAGPLIVREGQERARNELAVSNEIRSRQSRVPMLIESGGDRPMDLFYPLAPSPQSIEISYRNSSGEHVLILETQPELQGLHVDLSF